MISHIMVRIILYKNERLKKLILHTSVLIYLEIIYYRNSKILRIILDVRLIIKDTEYEI